jgi:hypothetical protein
MEADMETPSRSECSVFFSHKHSDENVTSSLIDLLKRHTKNVDFFISEKITKGLPWRQAIQDHLNRARFLVLVFTDPDENWEWCAYETGFFDALSQTRPSSRIWCLHHASTSPPSHLEGLQSIPVKTQDVTQWLTELFKETGQAGEQYMEIHEIVEEICKLFSVERKPLYSKQSIKITANRTLLSPDDLPDDASIEGDKRLMEELFGTTADKIDWKSIKEWFRKSSNSIDVNLRTLKEISNAIYCISKRIVFHHLQGIIFVDQGPKRYRPIISCAKEDTEDKIVCNVMFVEEVSGQLQNIPKRVEVLLTAIRMAMRIRWEIVRPFVYDSTARIQARSNPHKLRSDLQIGLNNIFLEAEFRGKFSKEDLLSAFETTDQKAILDIYDKWNESYPKIWRGIGFSDVNENFGEVSGGPMREEDLSLLEDGLRGVEEVNRDFLAMAVARGELLIQNELRTNIGVSLDEWQRPLPITPLRNGNGVAQGASNLS